MNQLKKIEQKNIEKAISDNFVKLMPSFYEMQSLFMSGLYKRYGDLEGGHIVIYFARDLHLQIFPLFEDLFTPFFPLKEKPLICRLRYLLYFTRYITCR